VKIGYQVALQLLRAGCTVVATTRFPNSAVDAFRQEDDFASFQDRLCVYGLDLRDVPGLETFIRYLKQRFASSGIDVLINNACQTVRRPVGYYTPMVEKEHELWTNGDETHRTVLSGCLEFENLRRRVTLDHEHQASQGQILPEPQAMDTDKAETSLSDALVPAPRPSSSSLVRSSSAARAPFERTGISHSAAMSQMIILPEDIGVNEDILPQGVSDINGQQLDLRKTNSWLLKMEEVSTPELMECMLVNAMAPFILNARLKPLMAIPTTDHRPDRYIINVSAMEGKVGPEQETPRDRNRTIYCPRGR
jgi:NAD(P)-dependent dehydrogenase (short-subunit alcohol dehydrogenase family)